MYTPQENQKIKEDKKRLKKKSKQIKQKYWYYLPETNAFINTNKTKEQVKRIRNVNEVIDSSEYESLRTDKIRLI
jgi:hypothetical protein